MTVIVTGGFGYIGSALTKVLGKRAYVIDCLQSPTTQMPATAVGHRFVTTRLSDTSFPVPMDEAAGAIHCAGRAFPHESVIDPRSYWKDNVHEPGEFFSRAPSSLPIVVTSSCAIYGESPIRFQEWMPSTPMNPYGNSKKAQEQMFKDCFEDVTILRCFNVAGGPGTERFPSRFIQAAARSALLGTTLLVRGGMYTVRDFVHLDDVVRAHMIALERGPSGHSTYNVGSGQKTRLVDVVTLVEKISGKRISVECVPIQPWDPQWVFSDTKAIEADLGWKPTKTLEDIVLDVFERVKATL